MRRMCGARKSTLCAMSSISDVRLREATCTNILTHISGGRSKSILSSASAGCGSAPGTVGFTLPSPFSTITVPRDWLLPCAVAGAAVLGGGASI